jgi:carbamoyl-phosphate synthase large subunit
MKSVGETMAIGRTFKEALQKGLRSLEIGRHGLGADGRDRLESDGSFPTAAEIEQKLATPNSQRIFYLRFALLVGKSIEEIYQLTGIDPWFLHQLKQIVDMERRLQELATAAPISAECGPGLPLTDEQLWQVKAMGFSDMQLAHLLSHNADQIARSRKARNTRPAYKLVDTCAAEFRAATPYYYSTYEIECEARVSDRKKVMILGGGPNRIGQGIEFDYCCVHASFALREEGIESIMVNSNPETVSTDYDTSDKLYFEPLTKEDVLHIVEKEKPFGVIVQFGGQTPLNLATPLAKAGVPILGTHPDSIDRAEDRKLFQTMLHKLGLVQPANGIALSIDEARQVAQTIGYPVIVRPSFVLGGRAMKIVYNEKELKNFARLAILASPGHPVLIDKFLENALEVDVDAICDGQVTIIGGIMEHIEAAGIHSGDSACVLPPHSIRATLIEEITQATKAMAQELNVIGLMNVQYAIQEGRLFVLEVNPRASRTVPFVSKATGVPLAKLATKIMLGRTLKDLGLSTEVVPQHLSVKEAVLPFDRFPNVDTLLGPEMKSTGEVMGMGQDFGSAYAKAQLGAGQKLPVAGTVFVSVMDGDKAAILDVARDLAGLGFTILATTGTGAFLRQRGIDARHINKLVEGRPHVEDAIKNGQIQLVINTGLGDTPSKDGYVIRRAALKFGVPYVTTAAGALAVSKAIATLKAQALGVKCLQEYHRGQPKKATI